MKLKISISVISVMMISIYITQGQKVIELNLKDKQTFSQAMRESLLLDTAKIPYKTLYDRVIGWSDLQNWNSGDTTSFTRCYG